MNETIKNYLRAFSEKNIEALSSLYDDNIVLWEWGQDIFMGRENVLSANKNLFGQVESLVVVVQTYAEASDKFFCELSIMLDGKLISVVDVITVKEDKILSISAYRGF